MSRERLAATKSPVLVQALTFLITIQIDAGDMKTLVSGAGIFHSQPIHLASE